MTGALCPWCAETPVSKPGELCPDCALNPDAVEFKAYHDAHCLCLVDREETS